MKNEVTVLIGTKGNLKKAVKNQLSVLMFALVFANSIFVLHSLLLEIQSVLIETEVANWESESS